MITHSIFMDFKAMSTILLRKFTLAAFEKRIIGGPDSLKVSGLDSKGLAPSTAYEISVNGCRVFIGPPIKPLTDEEYPKVAAELAARLKTLRLTSP